MILKRLILPFIYHAYQLTIMKKLKIVVFLALLLIIAHSIYLYKAVYSNHIEYARSVLDNQAGLIALKINDVNNSIDYDLKQVLDSLQISISNMDKARQASNIENMKVFFTRNENLITGMKYFDNKRNEFTLKRDETGKGWLVQQFVLHVQGEIHPDKKFIEGRRLYDYYLPVYYNNALIGNLVITVDIRQYFTDLFSL